MENEIDNLESLNPEEEIVPETIEEAEPISAEDLKKAKDYALNQKIRAEKAEAELKKVKSQPKEVVEVKNEMSLKDIRALSDVHDEDVDDVIDYAKYKGITIAEAKKSPAMTAILKAKAEERKTAEAANTAKQPRGSSKATDESLIEKAAQGELKEDDIERLAEARINQRMKK